MANRRKFTSEFKKKVVLEALKERETLSKLAQKYDVHPQQITTWKTYFLAHSEGIFEKEGSATKEQDLDKERDALLRTIGQQKVEINFFKKKVAMKPMHERRLLIERDHPELSLVRQCGLLGIHRSGIYYKPRSESLLNEELMRLMDEHYLEHPYKGAPRMYSWLTRDMQ